MGRRNRNQRSGNTISHDDDAINSISEDVDVKFSEALFCQLKLKGLCSSDEEYTSIADAVSSVFHDQSIELILREGSGDDLKKNLDDATNTLSEYLEDVLNESNAKEIIQTTALNVWGSGVSEILCVETKDLDDENSVDAAEGSNGEEDQDEDGEYIGEGECELCERSIKLTRHHLIPRTTWPRMKKRLWNAAPLIESINELKSGNVKKSVQENQQKMEEKLLKALGMNSIPRDLPIVITNDTVRNYLNTVSLLCRQCHSAIHSRYSEIELATEYNTIDKLLESNEVRNFAKWANKQRPGKYSCKMK